MKTAVIIAHTDCSASPKNASRGFYLNRAGRPVSYCSSPEADGQLTAKFGIVSDSARCLCCGVSAAANLHLSQNGCR